MEFKYLACRMIFLRRSRNFFMVLSNRLLDAIDGYLSLDLICNPITLSCPSSRPVAQKMGDNIGTSPSDLFQQLVANWQQRPEPPALIRRIHTNSSHPAPHQCSDSAEEWIRPVGKHQPRRKTAPPTKNARLNSSMPRIPVCQTG